jgi:hypothetical protein
MFDHQPSDRVDVFANSQGEFVQIWDSPRGTAGRRVLLTYLRTPAGPREVCQRVYFEDGPYELVVATDLCRVLYYRNSGEARHERFLPSGRRLIHDPRHGLKMRSVFTAEFDWEKQAPKGKPLGNKLVMRFQTESSVWYVSTYQETSSQPESLWLVEEHRGRELLRLVEFGLGITHG